jgi:hypothetical protein
MTWAVGQVRHRCFVSLFTVQAKKESGGLLDDESNKELLG